MNSNTDPREESDRDTGREERPHSSSKEAFEDLGRAFQEACRTGSDEAREAFEKAIPKAKDDLARGVHDLAYAIAYAASFGSTLVREVTPDNVKRGFQEGTDAGAKAADDVVRRRQRRKEEEASSSEGEDPGDEAILV